MNANDEVANKNGAPAELTTTIGDLPQIDIDVEVEVPKEVWAIAERRALLSENEFDNGSSMEDFLLDHINFNYTYVKEADT